MGDGKITWIGDTWSWVETADNSQSQPTATGDTHFTLLRPSHLLPSHQPHPIGSQALKTWQRVGRTANGRCIYWWHQNSLDLFSIIVYYFKIYDGGENKFFFSCSKPPHFLCLTQRVNVIIWYFSTNSSPECQRLLKRHRMFCSVEHTGRWPWEEQGCQPKRRTELWPAAQATHTPCHPPWSALRQQHSSSLSGGQLSHRGERH